MSKTSWAWSAFSALLIGSLVLGCAVNPVTGKRQLMLISESQEIQMGKEYDPQIVASIGLYEDEALQKYITGLALPVEGLRDPLALPLVHQIF